MENQDSRRRPLDAFRKVIDDAAMAVESDERVIDKLGDARRDGVGCKARVERYR
jgi:hypothetical protein